MTAFTGTFRFTLDHKGRVAIPAKFRRRARPARGKGPKARDGSGEQFLLAVGFDGCLALYPPEEWQRVEEKLSGLSFTHRDFRYVNRLLHSRAAEVATDAQGRITIPQEMLAATGIDKEVVIIGASRWVEIWNPEKYQSYVASFGRTFEEVAEQLFT